MATEHTADWLTKEGMIYSETDATGRTIATCKEQDDAELIVLAVNCHPKLVEACREALLDLRAVRETQNEGPTPSPTEMLLIAAIDSAEPF